MNKLFIGALILFLFSCFGCTTKRIEYDFNLKEVERPADAKKRHGESKIIRFEEEGKAKTIFEDESIKVIWTPTQTYFNFVLTNKTSHSAMIIWDEALYVNELGASIRAMHKGVKYANRNESQPPSVILRGATLTDFVYPTENVYFFPDGNHVWGELPLLPNLSRYPGESVNKQKIAADSVIGKNIQILLPIKIADVVNEYIFIFNISGYSIK